MPQLYTYYVPLLIHNGEGSIGFTVRFAKFEERITEQLAVAALITWTEEIFGIVPEDKDDLPLIALNWILFSAKRGATVKAPTPKRGNGRST